MGDSLLVDPMQNGDWLVTDVIGAATTASLGGGPTGAAGGALAGNYPDPDLDPAVAGGGLEFHSNVVSLNAGIVMSFPGDAAQIPAGFLLCDGSAVSRGTYSRLFNAIGENNGPGNGVSTFNLPDYRDKLPKGAADNAEVGTTGGVATVALSAPRCPLTRTGSPGSRSPPSPRTRTASAPTPPLRSRRTLTGSGATLPPTNRPHAWDRELRRGERVRRTRTASAPTSPPTRSSHTHADGTLTVASRPRLRHPGDRLQNPDDHGHRYPPPHAQPGFRQHAHGIRKRPDQRGRVGSADSDPAADRVDHRQERCALACRDQRRNRIGEPGA